MIPYSLWRLTEKFRPRGWRYFARRIVPNYHQLLTSLCPIIIICVLRVTRHWASPSQGLITDNGRPGRENYFPSGSHLTPSDHFTITVIMVMFRVKLLDPLGRGDTCLTGRQAAATCWDLAMTWSASLTTAPLILSSLSLSLGFSRLRHNTHFDHMKNWPRYVGHIFDTVKKFLPLIYVVINEIPKFRWRSGSECWCHQI